MRKIIAINEKHKVKKRKTIEQRLEECEKRLKKLEQLLYRRIR